jgi:hypothetical protein
MGSLKTRQEPTMDAKFLVIALLALGLVVLGYLYYDSQQHGVSIDLPNVKIEAK